MIKILMVFNIINKLRLKQKTKNTPSNNIENKIFDTKVVDVYDGDTCDVVIKYQGKFKKIRIRCYGYDTPELRPSKSLENRDEIIRNAKLAKIALIQLVTNNNFKLSGDIGNDENKAEYIINNHKNIIKVKIIKGDKYFGRYIGKLYTNNIDINQKMIDLGHGYEYYGGKKN